MATTQAEAEVIERKLRPVYDAIDNGQNKKAAQMVDKILRKQEDLNCAKALKGIALMRMGRHDEGIGLIEGVMRTSPGDQATLQAVTMFFKETGDNKRIVALYATAAQHYPKNGEILTHLFMAYVRIGDYQKQQQTAASLHKVFPLNGPYYCWRIMSILMQAHEAGDDSTVATTMFLPLAEKLIEKYVSEKRIETEAEVKLYLMVLEKLGKTERRLEVVRGELAEKFRSRDEKNTVELECLLTLKLWDEAVKKLTELLQKTPDQWSFIAAYINSQIQRSLEARERGDDGEEEEEEEEREEEDEREGGGKEEGEQESGGQQDQEKELKNETMSCSSEAEGSSVETSSATKTSSGDSGATERTEREQPASEQERQSESGDGEQQKQPESGDGEQQKQSESGDGEQQKQPESGDGEQQKQPESGDGEQQKQSESGDGEQEKQPESGDGEQQKQSESGDGEQQKQPESGDGEQQKQPESGDGEQQKQPESGDGEQEKQPESGDGEQQKQSESGDGEQQKQPESGDGEQEKQPESGDGEQEKQPESGDGEQQKQSESGDGEQQKQPESGDGEQEKQPESGDGEQEKQPESGDGEQQKQPESGDGEQQEQPESGDGEQQKQPESGDGEQQKQPESGDGEQQKQPESGDGEQQKQPESGDGEQEKQPESGDGEQQKQPESGDGEQQQELKAGDTPSVGEANSGENTSESVEKAQHGEQSGCSETSTAPPASAVVWWVRPLVKAKSFLEKLTTKEKRKAGEQSARTHIVRGPFLGRMELVKQLTANGLAGHMELDTPVKLLMDYFCVFGTKSCVFEDLKTYLDVFPQEDIKEFLVKVEEKVNTEPIQFDCEDDKIKENMGRLRQHTSMVQLQRATGAHQDLSVAEVKELVAQCKHYYKEGLKLGRGLTPSVNQPADFYIIVASHLQMTLYQRTGNISLLWEAIFMLEYARKTNAQFSLLLMKLYAVLGVGEVMTDLYEGLYIKHLQMETLGYIPVRYLPAVGCFGLSDQLYRSGQRFYYNCSNEIAEYIIQAYKNGMFQKIVEFVELRERLAHSFNFSCMLVDMSLLELLTSVHSVQQGREFFQKESFSGLPYTSPNLEDYCSKLVDSRDLSVFDDWNPTCNRLSETDSEISFSLECLWLRTRVILLQCLQEATRLVLNNTAPSSGPSPTASSNSGKETTCNGGEVAASLSRRMKQFVRVLELLGEHRGVAMMKEARCRPLLGMSCGLLGPPSCLGFVFLEESHGRVLREMLSATEQVALGAPSIKERLKEILGTLQTTKSRISGIPGELREALMKLASSSHQGEADPSLQGPSHPYHLLSRTSVTVERYVLFLQTVNLLVLLSGMSAEIANPRVPGESKKKRKKKGASKNPVGEELVGFVKELKVLLLSVSQQFHPLPAVEGNLADLLSRTYIPRDVEEGPNFEQTVVPRTCKGVLESYNMSFRDCVEVVQSKVEFMNAIIKRLGGSLD